MRRKRKRQQIDSDLYLLTGVQLNESQASASNELCNCLSQMSEAAGANNATNNEAGSMDRESKEKQKLPRDARDKERLRTWRQGFVKYVNSGEYDCSLLPSFDVELSRHFQIGELSKFILSSVPALKMPAFERWLLDSKLEASEDVLTDPILSKSVSVDFQSSQRLVEEIVELGQPSEKALNLVRQLCTKATREAIPDIQSEVRRCSSTLPLKKAVIECLDKDDIKMLSFQRKKWKKPFTLKMNCDHYHKLRTLFEKTHGPVSWVGIKGKASRATHAFNYLVMILLLRYSSISGGQLIHDLRGGGMQGAVDTHIFGVLEDLFTFCTQVECFASPLNATWPTFLSAFSRDIDWFFGSTGDFFSFEGTPNSLCMEVNPPFSPGLMTQMAKNLVDLTVQAEARQQHLTVVVIVPTVDLSTPVSHLKTVPRFCRTSFAMLVECSACVRHVVLKREDHGYIEGAQHIRPTRYKDSTYDTSMIILQTKVPSDLTDLNLMEDRLRIAFQSRHKTETETRQTARKS